MLGFGLAGRLPVPLLPPTVGLQPLADDDPSNTVFHILLASEGLEHDANACLLILAGFPHFGHFSSLF